MAQKKNKGNEIEEKINAITKAIGKQSDNSANAMPLLQMITQFAPLLEDLNEFSTQLQYGDTMMIYIKYHNFIKQLESESNEVTTLTKASLTAGSDSEKFKQIKVRVMKAMEKLAALQKEALDQNKMVLMWIDPNKENNDEELQEFQENYNGNVDILYYTDYDKFKNEIQKYQSSPLIIIMSAVAAGSDKLYKNGDIFNFLKQNMKNYRIKGSIIYCGDTGYKNLEHLKNDPSRLLTLITTSYYAFLEGVKALIIPVNFNRLVPLQYLDFFLPKAKQRFISKNLDDLSNKSLSDFKKVDFTQIFNEAYEYSQQQNIKFKPEVLKNLKGIPIALQKIFSTSTNENDIADKIIKSYTQQNLSQPIYPCINSVLNILNEQLLIILEPFIDLFMIALVKYDDSKETLISKGKPMILYKGSGIPTDQFEDQIKENQFAVLPGFSSFSNDLDTAKNFILNDASSEDTGVLFEYEYSTGSQLYHKRPKLISRVSDYPSESEYLVHPFTVFKIGSITKEGYYFKIKLQLR